MQPGYGQGDFVILADHDDTLPPNAFYEVVKASMKIRTARLFILMRISGHGWKGPV